MKESVRLVVRGDDIGSTYASNIACIDCYRNGIMRSTEIMAPCSWFEHACRLLNENPGLDVGVHLVLTSEWAEYKWRPLTNCASITGPGGYFHPMVWPGDGFPPECALAHASWRIEELEAELRAQIELCLARLPHVSHLTGHMGWENINEESASLLDRLTRSYGLECSGSAEPMQVMSGYNKSGPLEEQIRSFVDGLRELTAGTWLFVEHPAADHPEMAGIRHFGYEDVRGDRSLVSRVLTSREVIDAVYDFGIELISYRDLRVG